MTHATPPSNKQLRKSRVRTHLLNSLCNSQSRSREMISELHNHCQQIRRPSGTRLNITSLTEVYVMLTIKHKDEEHWTNI